MSYFATFKDAGPKRQELYINKRNHPANEEEYWPRLSVDVYRLLNIPESGLEQFYIITDVNKLNSYPRSIIRTS